MSKNRSNFGTILQHHVFNYINIQVSSFTNMKDIQPLDELPDINDARCVSINNLMFLFI